MTPSELLLALGCVLATHWAVKGGWRIIRRTIREAMDRVDVHESDAGMRDGDGERNHPTPGAMASAAATALKNTNGPGAANPDSLTTEGSATTLHDVWQLELAAIEERVEQMGIELEEELTPAGWMALEETLGRGLREFSEKHGREATSHAVQAFIRFVSTTTTASVPDTTHGEVDQVNRGEDAVVGLGEEDTVTSVATTFAGQLPDTAAAAGPTAPPQIQEYRREETTVAETRDVRDFTYQNARVIRLSL